MRDYAISNITSTYTQAYTQQLRINTWKHSQIDVNNIAFFASFEN